MKGKRIEDKGGELLEINIQEVSIVDAPANRRKFLLLKRDENGDGIQKADADIRIQTDKTLEGTTITVNGKEIEDLTSFYFSYYKPAEDEELYIDPVSCSYTVTGDVEDGFETSETSNLSKAEGNKMLEYPRIIACAKALNGAELTQTLIDKMDDQTQEAWNIITQYDGQMPSDLTQAVGQLLKDAAETESEADTDEGTKPEPKPKRSDEELAAIQVALKAITDLLSAGDEDEDEDEASDPDPVLKKVTEIADRLAKLEKGEDPEPKPKDAPPDESGVEKILASVKEIESRLLVVEKAKGVEKGLQNADGGTGGSDEEDLYKSVPL